jgi:hypothetical protein
MTDFTKAQTDSVGSLASAAHVDDFRSGVAREVDKQAMRSQIGVKRWNFYYYVSLLGSIVFATVAALLPKLGSIPDGFVRSDLPSILAATSALLTTLMHAGSFERRWRAARVRRLQTNELRIELLDPLADPRNVLERLKKAISAYHYQVLAKTDEPLSSRSSVGNT